MWACSLSIAHPRPPRVTVWYLKIPGNCPPPPGGGSFCIIAWSPIGVHPPAWVRPCYLRGCDSNSGKALITSSGKLSPARGYGETETNLPSFHRQDKGKPRENTRARSHTAREGRPGLDAPPRVACAGLRHRPAPLPDLSSSSTLREWFLTTGPLLLGEQYSCTHYLTQSVNQQGGEDTRTW